MATEPSAGVREPSARRTRSDRVLHDDLGMAPIPDAELDRQLATLLDKEYPALAGISRDELAEQVEALRPHLPEDGHPERIPFLLVVRHETVPSVAAVERLVVRGEPGFTDMDDDELDSFIPVDGVHVPESPVYLVTDVDTGAATLNVRPDDALPVIREQGRTPLTVDEGVALVTQLPDVLKLRNCFQTLGSRCGDRRVPSFWVSYGKPRLGWCWAGNPHTWLGAASAADRQGSG